MESRNIISENIFIIKGYLTVCKTKSLQFIISLGYIFPKSITIIILVLLNNMKSKITLIEIIIHLYKTKIKISY